MLAYGRPATIVSPISGKVALSSTEAADVNHTGVESGRLADLGDVTSGIAVAGDRRDRDAERKHEVGEFVDVGRVRARFDRKDEVDVEPRASGESLDVEAHDLAQRSELATDLFVGRTARVIDRGRHPSMVEQHRGG
jgi:hypothetical protein